MPTEMICRSCGRTSGIAVARNTWSTRLCPCGHQWNPLAGGSREHRWARRETFGFTACSACGIVRRADGKNKPCRGPVVVRPRTDHPGESPQPQES